MLYERLSQIENETYRSFAKACTDRDITTVNTIYNTSHDQGEDIDLNMENGLLFFYACGPLFRSLEIVQFLFEKLNEQHKRIDIDIERVEYFSVRSYEDLFFYACGAGSLNLARWLYENASNNNEPPVDISSRDNYAFCCACAHGSIEGIEWITSLTEIDIHMSEERPFRWACGNGKQQGVEWLMNKANEQGTVIDIHAKNDEAFRYACKRNRIDTVEWLHTQCPELVFEYHEQWGPPSIGVPDMTKRLRDVPFDQYDKHTILILCKQSECTTCVVCEEEENVYELPCSKLNSKHLLCGQCVFKLVGKNTVKCPYCGTVNFIDIVRHSHLK